MKSSRMFSSVLLLGLFVLSTVSAAFGATVVNTEPEANDMVLYLVSYATVTFDVDMDPATINNESIIVRSQFDGVLSGVVTYYPEWRRATFQMEGGFRPGDAITVTVSTVAKPASVGDSFDGYTWSFTTTTCSEEDFYPSVEYDLHSGAEALVSADFNGDGLADIVTVSQVENVVSVLLNDGNGAFPTYENVYLGAGRSPNSQPAAADFDGDGDIDVAVGCWENHAIVVLANNGKGMLSVRREIGVSGLSGGCYPADMDADGDVDLVVGLAWVDAIGVVYNDGKGVFGNTKYLYTLDNPDDPKAADFNNDGLLDLVVVNKYSNVMSVFINNGGGQFAGRVDYPQGNRPTGIIAADLNGDGNLDLASNELFGGTVAVWLGDGSGNFGTRTAFSVDAAPSELTCGDFDGDGNLDLATVSSDGCDISVLYNDGSASFTESTMDDFLGCSYCITAVDIDGDGSVDLATANYSQTIPGSVSIILNFGLPPAPTLISPDDQAYLLLGTYPYLNCSDVETAFFYHFEIANDEDFESIVESEVFNSNSGYTVETLLDDGTYFWRVSAGNNCGWSDWSEVRSFTMTSGSGPSCPVLFSFDGEGFVKQNPLLTACERSGYTREVVDYYHVTSPVVEMDGNIAFQLREMEDEITYLRGFDLITVDHDINTNVACAVDGQIFTFNSTVAPKSAIDQNGVDWAEAVKAADGTKFTADGSGYLVLTFPNTGAKGPMAFHSLDKAKCPNKPPDPGPSKANDQYVPQPNSFTIEQLMANDMWVTLPAIPTRATTTTEFVMPDLSGIGPSDALTVRISWQGPFSTDGIFQCVLADSEPVVNQWKFSGFELDADNPQSRDFSGFNGQDFLELRKGESIEFTFDVDRMDDPTKVRSYVVRSAGRYEPDFIGSTGPASGEVSLDANYPNPFNPTTEISFSLPKASHVNLEVFNIVGQKITTLVDRHMQAGRHTVSFNGSSVASGVYFYRLQTGEVEQTKKMMLAK